MPNDCKHVYQTQLSKCVSAISSDVQNMLFPKLWIVITLEPLITDTLINGHLQ
jgi:hypothetical protein